MPAVQHLLAIARPLAARVRSVRRPFRPSGGEGAYRLPKEVAGPLAAALQPFRNREAAFALAVFLARFWSAPKRLGLAFPVDRRALSEHGELELTEARVRGALKALEAVGFLERAIPPVGSPYKATEDGLRRKPILFVLGADYAPAFIAANRRARAARGGDRRDRRALTPAAPPRPSTAFPGAPTLSSPKSKASPGKGVLMGEVRIGFSPQPSAQTPLEAALARFAEAAGFGRGESGSR